MHKETDEVAVPWGTLRSMEAGEGKDLSSIVPE